MSGFLKALFGRKPASEPAPPSPLAAEPPPDLGEAAVETEKRDMAWGETEPDAAEHAVAFGESPHEPAHDELANAAPALDELANAAPALDEPAHDEPARDEPAHDEPPRGAEPGPGHDAAVAALHAAADRGDLAQTLRLGEALRTEAPDAPAGYVLPARVLRDAGRLDEAEALLAELDARGAPPDLLGMITQAELASARRDFARLERQGAALTQAFPEHMIGAVMTTTALREQGRGEAAEAVISAARDRWPDELVVLITWAETALRRRDWDEAARRAAELRDRFPGHHAGYTMLTDALRGAGRGPELDAALQAACTRFPADSGLLARWTEQALHDRSWAEAASRASLIRARFPGIPEGYALGVRALRGTGELDGAKTLVAQGMQLSHPDPSLHLAWAEVAIDGGDWAEAEEAAARMRELYPEQWIGWFLGVRALSEQGREDEAEWLLAAGRDRIAPEPAIETVWTDLAMRRRDWAEAASRAEHARALFPDVANGTMQGVVALMELGRHEEAATLGEDGAARFPGDSGIARVAAEARAACGARVAAAAASVAEHQPAAAAEPAHAHDAGPPPRADVDEALAGWHATAAGDAPRADVLREALRVSLLDPWHDGVQPLFHALGSERPDGDPAWRPTVEQAPRAAVSPEQFHVWREASAAFLHDAQEGAPDGLEPETLARWRALIW